MGFSKIFATAAVLSSLISTPFAFDADLKSNVAVYYGQGPNQPRLAHFCEETSLDIVNLGFVNSFPTVVGQWPGSNFGNQCDGLYFLGSTLLSGCHQIWEDIPVCQALGKKVFLSVGGDSAYPVPLVDEVAEWFADFLWYSFGPNQAETRYDVGLFDSYVKDIFPRPLQNVSVDGFDFDVEHNGGQGYATLINRLRSRFEESPDRKFYISGSPQCPIPDTQLSDAIQNSAFDFIWVQFYNSQGCSAADYANGSGNFNYGDWVDVIKKSANPSAKLYVGLPASEDAANAGYYITPSQVKPLVEEYIDLYPETFGGIMLWEATSAENNIVDGQDYSQHMKHILYECAPPPKPTPTPTPTQTVTPIPTHTSASSSSVQSSVSVTPSSSASSTPSISSVVKSSSTAASSISSVIPSSSPHASHSSSHSFSTAESSSIPIPSASSASSPVASSSSTLRSATSPTVKSSSIPGPSTSSASSPVASSSNTLRSATSSTFKSSSIAVSSSSSVASSSSSHPSHSSSSSVSSAESISTPCPSTLLPASSSSKTLHLPTLSTVKSSSAAAASSSSAVSSSTQNSSKATTPVPHSHDSIGVNTGKASSTGKNITPSGSSVSTSTILVIPTAARSTSVRIHSSFSSIGKPTSTPLVITVSSSSSTAVRSGVSSSEPFSDNTAFSSRSSTDAQSQCSTAQTSVSYSTGVSLPMSSPTSSPREASTQTPSATVSNTPGTGIPTVTSYISAGPSVTPAPSSSQVETITTVIVTSYTSICPTGFTTITTTYTTYVCPEASATAIAIPGVTSPASGEATTTASIPEGWTTTVTVCTHCAATPTTVTLTLPNPTTMGPTTSAVTSETTVSATTEPAVVTASEAWTTTVTFCKQCGPTGSTLTLTVPHTPAAFVPATASVPASNPTGSSGEESQLSSSPKTTVAQSASAVSGIPQSKSRVIGTGHGGVHPVSQGQSQTFAVHPSSTNSAIRESPVASGTETLTGASSTYTGAGSRSVLVNVFGVALAGFMSLIVLI